MGSILSSPHNLGQRFCVNGAPECRPVLWSCLSPRRFDSLTVWQRTAGGSVPVHGKREGVARTSHRHFGMIGKLTDYGQNTGHSCPYLDFTPEPHTFGVGTSHLCSLGIDQSWRESWNSFVISSLTVCKPSIPKKNHHEYLFIQVFLPPRVWFASFRMVSLFSSGRASTPYLLSSPEFTGSCGRLQQTDRVLP